MKLQPDKLDVQAITGYGPGWVGVNTERVTHSVIIGSGGERIEWKASRFEDLGAEHFEQVAAVDAEVVIFGSGSRIRFPRPAWLKPLIDRHVGVEKRRAPRSRKTPGAAPKKLARNLTSFSEACTAFRPACSHFTVFLLNSRSGN